MPGVSTDNLPEFSKGGRLTAEDLNKIVAALGRQQLLPGSFQTGAFHVQRPLGGGGGGGSFISTFGVVTTEVSPAAGTVDSITPGTGEVQLYATDVDGVRTPYGDPISVFNYDPGETYLVRTGVYLAGEDGGTPEVISGFCLQFDEAP